MAHDHFERAIKPTLRENLDPVTQIAPVPPTPLAMTSDQKRIADLEEKVWLLLDWKASMEAKERPAVAAESTKAAGTSNTTRKSRKTTKPEPKSDAEKSEDQPPALASATTARPKRAARVMAAAQQCDPAPGRASRAKPVAPGFTSSSWR